MAVTRDDVIQTAIQLLQEVGLDGLTLRRLARGLDIKMTKLSGRIEHHYEAAEGKGSG